MKQILRERKLIYYSNSQSKEFTNHYNKMQQEGWTPIDEHIIEDNGYEVEYEKWFNE
jgi:hypothetical protein